MTVSEYLDFDKALKTGMKLIDWFAYYINEHISEYI
jgi:hypothetical protein